ncbi:MAG: uncharacterized protein K0S45_3070 [Nitrospira sp.]|nr:uncharacterized protein [Nitrospira sp.]
MTNAACHRSPSAAVHQFIELLEQRKTRRFGLGMELPAGPLQYRSPFPPLPLTPEEERHLIFAGVGKTGPHSADMQFSSRPQSEDGQGMALMSFQGRTVPSACAAQTTRLFFTNDEGTYFVEECAAPDDPAMTKLTKLSSQRLEIPRQLPFMLSFNQWYANRPGTSYFIPVTNIASVYLNLLLVLLSDEYGYFIVDSDNGNEACGLDRFKKSRGGHLHDDPAKRRTMSLRDLDSAISDTAIQEQGIVAEHISLMEQAMGLGGGIHSVGSGRHLLGMEPQIFPGLGFQFHMPSGGARRPNPIGLPGIWTAPCPPYGDSMETAVLTLIDSKFGASGMYRTPDCGPWNRSTVKPNISRHSEQAIAATIAFAEYVVRTYGRFPAHVDAFKSIVACQAHHLDLSFYETYYPDSAVSQSHHDHMASWHEGQECLGYY